MFKKISLLTIFIICSISQSSYSMQHFNANNLKWAGTALVASAGAVWIFLKHKVGGYERVAKKLEEFAKENNYAAAKKLLDEGVPGRPSDVYKAYQTEAHILNAAKSAIDHNNMQMLDLILDNYSEVLVINPVVHRMGWHNFYPDVLMEYAAKKYDRNPAILQNIIGRLRRYPAGIGPAIQNGIMANINGHHYGPQEFIAFKAFIDQGAKIDNAEVLHTLVTEALRGPGENNRYLERLDYLLTTPIDLESERYGRRISDYLQFKGKNKDTIIRIRELISGKRKRIILDDTPAIACLPVPLLKIIVAYAYEDEFQVLLAIRNFESNKLRYLLENGYTPDAKNDNGKTALMYAAEAGNGEVVEILLAHRADTLAVENHGMNAVMFAAERGYANFIRLIFQATPAAERQNMINKQSTHSYRPPSRFVRRRGGPLAENRYVAQRRPKRVNGGAAAAAAADAPVLGAENNLAHVDITDDVANTTALILAAKNGHQAVVEALLELGADKTLGDARGESALAHAQRNRHEAIIKMLQA